MKNLGNLAIIASGLWLTSCERGLDPAPSLTVAVSTNAAAVAPVPCASQGYGVDANGVGAYQLPTPRTVHMTPILTNLSYYLLMTQTKYTISPTGKELSVWHGVDLTMPPASRQVWESTAWSECGKGYQSKCVRYTDGRVTLSLTTDPTVLPFED